MLVPVVVSLWIASAPVGGGTIHVPADFPTIQQAIDAAVDGDVVLVDPGTYVERIDFLGKDITVQSTAGPDVTIIDGNELGSVVTFQNGETRAAVLEGFTITRGLGSEVTDEDGTNLAGGGIFCRAASPTVRGNRIENNGLGTTKHASEGGGVFCEAGASPSLESNLIAGNYAGLWGGGVFASGAPLQLLDNEFLDNFGYYGRALLIESSTAVIVHGNRFSGVRGYEDEVELWLCDCAGQFSSNQLVGDPDSYSRGLQLQGCQMLVSSNEFSGFIVAAVYLLDTRDRLESNWFHDNFVGLYDSALVIEDSDVDLRANRFESNRGVVDGGAITAYGSFVRLTNNQFSDNQVDYGGGALFASVGVLQGRGNLFVRNRADESGGGALEVGPGGLYQGVLDTFADNEAATGAGAVWRLSDGVLELDHCILWGNRAGGVASSIGPSPDGANVRYCDVEGGWPGEGNIDVDPRFVSPPAGDYSLALDSPCVDAGEKTFVPRGTDLAGTPRWLDSNLDRAAAADLGAFELGHGRLSVSGSSTPASTLTFEISGTPSLFAFLWFGVAPGDHLLPPYGTVFIDLSAPWFLFPVGVTPISVDLVIPDGVPMPFYFTVQALCVSPSNAAGNFTNSVEVVLQ